MAKEAEAEAPDPFINLVRGDDVDFQVRFMVSAERSRVMLQVLEFRTEFRNEVINGGPLDHGDGRVMIYNLNSDDESDEDVALLRPNVRQHLTDLFVVEHGLNDVDTVEDVGVIINVAGDGHCLHRAFMAGLYDYAVEPLYLFGQGFGDDGASARLAHFENLSNNFMSSWRERIRRHLEANQSLFVSSNHKIRDVAFSDHDRCTWIETDRRTSNVKAEFLDRIWNANTDFNRPLGPNFWNGNAVILVLCHFWRRTVVHYSSPPNGGRHCFIAYWSNDICKLRVHVLKVPSQQQGRRGKRPSHPFIALWKGCCTGSDYRKKERQYFCTTEYVGGLDYAELLKFSQSSSSTTTLIKFRVKFTGRCFHHSRDSHGILKGRARKRRRDEVFQSKKKPKEMTKHLIGKMCRTKLSCNNTSGEVTDVKTIYNLRYEAKQLEKKRKGIRPDVPNYENIRYAAENTREQDLEMRKANGDHCIAIPGILQTFEVYPTFNIHLHGRNMLLVAALLASEKRLVMGIDATGNLLNVPNSSFDGKIQHTLMTIQASECLLQEEDAGNYGDNLFHSVRVAERASPSNKTSDFSAWIIQVRKDTMTVTESYPGAGDGIDPIPSVVKMDCALELAHGCLEGFRSNHHVATGQLYNNIFNYILRRHDSLILDAKDDFDVKRVSKITYSRILAHSPCIIKQCKSHVHRAVSSYRKNKTNKPIEFRIHSEAFDQIFLLIANEMTAIGSMSELIVRLSIFVALFETEYIQCPLFDMNSEVHAHHETQLAETVAAKMNTVATEEMEKMLIPTDEEMDSCIQRELDNAREGKRIIFNSHLDARTVIDRMKQDINFGVTYLESIDSSAKKGKVKICLVYYCYRREADNTVHVSPRKYGSFSVEVDLPHMCGKLRNPLYSPTAARYLLLEWMSRSALWSQQPISVAEKAMDARIFNNNQSLEGTFCCEKHGVSTVAEDFGDIPSMVHRRYNDSIEEGRLFAMQIKKSEALLKSRRLKRQKKGHPKKDDDSDDMVWKGAPRSVKGMLDQWNDMMHRALRIARDNGEVEYKDNVRISKYRVMRKFADETDSSFMSETTFKNWLAGERKAPLDNDWTRVIKKFSDKHTTK